MGWGCVKCRRCDFVEVFLVATISFAFSLDWHGRSMQGSFSVMYGQAMKRWVKLCLSVFLHLGVSCPIFAIYASLGRASDSFSFPSCFCRNTNRSVAWQERLRLLEVLDSELCLKEVVEGTVPCPVPCPKKSFGRVPWSPCQFSLQRMWTLSAIKWNVGHFLTLLRVHAKVIL